MNNMRRKICQSLGALFGATSLVACAQPEVKKPECSYTEDEQRRMGKFKGVNGYELWVSIFARVPSSRGLYCKVVTDTGRILSQGIGIRTAEGGHPPKAIRATLLDDTDANWKDIQPVIVGDWIAPVADRIPDELLDDLRRDPRGMLRIKIRLHREGVLLGWDIERRPNPWQLPQEEWFAGGVSRVPQPAWTHTGGDFKEARSAEYVWEGSGFKGLPANIPPYSPEIRWKRPWRYDNLIAMPSAESLGGVVPKQWAEQGLYIANVKDHLGNYRGVLKEKGWYIHPKTGQRIETDF